MSLKARFDEDLKAAMRAREAGKTRLSVLRLIKAAVKNAEIEKGHELSDDEVIQVLARELKARRDVLPEYERSGRADLLEQLKGEIAILQEYLPEPISPEELRAICRRAVEAAGATSPRDIGKVMGPLMKELRGRADGNEVRRVVEEILKGAP